MDIPEIDREFSIGFLTALVSHELVSCEVALKETGWTNVTISEKLRHLAIKKWQKKIGRRNVTAYSTAINDMGQTASAIETFAFLDRVKPNVAILTGIAGSLDQNYCQKGDVIVGMTTHWRGQNKIFGDGPCDEYRDVHHILKAYDDDFSKTYREWVGATFPRKERPFEYAGEYNVYPSEIFTWDYVIDSERVTRKISSHFPMAACVEMEAGGFLRATDRYQKLADYNIERYVVRGISDYAMKKDAVETVRTAASKNAALTAVKLAEWRVSEAEIGRRSANTAK